MRLCTRAHQLVEPTLTEFPVLPPGLMLAHLLLHAWRKIQLRSPHLAQSPSSGRAFLAVPRGAVAAPVSSSCVGDSTPAISAGVALKRLFFCRCRGGGSRCRYESRRTVATRRYPNAPRASHPSSEEGSKCQASVDRSEYNGILGRPRCLPLFYLGNGIHGATGHIVAGVIVVVVGGGGGGEGRSVPRPHRQLLVRHGIPVNWILRVCTYNRSA